MAMVNLGYTNISLLDVSSDVRGGTSGTAWSVNALNAPVRVHRSIYHRGAVYSKG
jgi:hypothetical protein